MELKSTILGTLLLFLLLVAAPSPCLSKERLVEKNMDPEFYDIDYKGPETHTYPPPNSARGRPSIHHGINKTHRKSKGFRVSKSGAKGKKIHV